MQVTIPIFMIMTILGKALFIFAVLQRGGWSHFEDGGSWSHFEDGGSWSHFEAAVLLHYYCIGLSLWFDEEIYLVDSEIALRHTSSKITK